LFENEEEDVNMDDDDIYHIKSAKAIINRFEGSSDGQEIPSLNLA
jgi:hypothetical protein